MKQVAIANAKTEAQKAAVKDLTKNQLISWGLLAEDEDGCIHPTNGYVFLQGKDEFLSQIQCGMFKGKTGPSSLIKGNIPGRFGSRLRMRFSSHCEISVWARSLKESTGRTSTSCRRTAFGN